MKQSKFVSLISSVVSIILSIIIVGISVLWLLGILNVEPMIKTILASQIAILICGLSLFNYDLKEIKEIFNDRINSKIIMKTLKITVLSLLVNIFIGVITKPFMGNQSLEVTEGLARSETVLRGLIMPIIFAPVLEEFAFRAGLKYALVDKGNWGPRGYVIISSILFGLLHWTPGSPSLLHILVTSGLGVVWGISYIKINNIYVSMFSHMLYNAVIVSASFLYL